MNSEAFNAEKGPGDPMLIADNGDIVLPKTRVPFSKFCSAQAKDVFLRLVNQPYPIPTGPVDVAGVAVERWRADFDEQHFKPLVQQWLRQYPAVIEERVIGGVMTDAIKPAQGIDRSTANQVLINLHGGGFIIGARYCGHAESIPVAVAGGFEVISVDYRMGPEHVFPTASIDVATVYRELLRTYPPENIGVFGHSAGGWLTAQALAWFQQEQLPMPGAIAIICAGAGGMGEGDSAYTWPLSRVSGSGAPPVAYLRGADMEDPLVAPLYSPSTLAKFPPTLIMTSTRAVDLSPGVHTEIQLKKAGVDTELHVWDGLGHGDFINNPHLPEAEDAIEFLVNFFHKHLQNRRRAAATFPPV
jgi:epsilon-lactone hydrolase